MTRQGFIYSHIMQERQVPATGCTVQSGNGSFDRLSAVDSNKGKWIPMTQRCKGCSAKTHKSNKFHKWCCWYRMVSLERELCDGSLRFLWCIQYLLHRQEVYGAKHGSSHCTQGTINVLYVRCSGMIVSAWINEHGDKRHLGSLTSNRIPEKHAPSIKPLAVINYLQLRQLCRGPDTALRFFWAVSNYYWPQYIPTDYYRATALARFGYLSSRRMWAKPNA